MKPSTLFVLGTCGCPLGLMLAAGLPGRSEADFSVGLPPIPTPLIAPPAIDAAGAGSVEISVDPFADTTQVAEDTSVAAADAETDAFSGQSRWIRTNKRIRLNELADGLGLSADRLAQLNGLAPDHTLNRREWVVLPESAEAKLFMVAALDDSTLQAKRPAGFERRPLLAKLSALSEVANQAALSPAYAGRRTLAIVPSASGGLSWPRLPEFGNLRRPQLSGFIWPAKGALTSGYGWRWGRMHKGIDVANSVGTPIVAAADGRVVFSGWNSVGYGYLVELAHSDGSKTRYAHNSSLLVKKGMNVLQGTPIARMGSTGRSTGPHLHFEIHRPGQGAVNPVQLLAAR